MHQVTLRLEGRSVSGDQFRAAAGSVFDPASFSRILPAGPDNCGATTFLEFPLRAVSPDETNA